MNLDGKPAAQSLQDDLEAVVDKHRGTGISLGEMLAAMEIVKLNLWLEQRRLQDQEDAGDDPALGTSEDWRPEP